jgi:YebC/PmpR family DNA-binding regulatory protein
VKEAGDKKRAQIFSKMARLISVAVKTGGPNPETNPKLRLAIETARQMNVPKDNIERAIKRGVGEIAGEKLEEVLFEALGPGGVALIIEGITDNKRRALEEIKQVLNQNSGKLVGEGAVKWMFERKIKERGVIEWIPKHETEVDEKTKRDCEKLFEALDNLDSVQEIYSNMKL